MEKNTIKELEDIALLLEKFENFLTENQRKVLSYRFLEDYSYQEIADILKISKPASYDAVNKAKQKLLDISKKLQV
ncbi:sigma factor-like helix-turn-helix DNA-binding protein [[Mycoplasma] mobile]|uniref:Uncharacterized protein n=1 Tax=Mycoplasma mobile (strain ATCC 43663 / 163K / NCTC 11711) TaxID=267748 RepID=Q6KIN7_MYCM1|nr:sigma factor-like helix-turn-helix DNA-binding protein [[Mycoplasma] mobile]AAT27539.1 hypothetical protein MMOB0530 [Mycoplasma mobile 163K]